uniref:Ig-like domain-containing protein n=1 Tax=Cyprinus carpio carpio TaxID=630221 RepID=A0A8C1BI97_CYPCA
MLLQYLFLMLLDGAFGAETDETVSVMEGDSVTLHTNLTEVLNDDTILWLFGRKDSIISQITRKQDLTSFFVTDDARFRGRLQVDQKTGTLTIRKTRIKHSGQYKLTVSRKQTTTKIFNVTVIDVVGETDGVKSVSVMEGDPVTLQCDVSEVQRDDLIVWRFGDKGLLLAKIDVESNETLLNDADERFRDRLKLSESRSLTIKKTRTTDSGLYEVQIRGSESSQRFLLSVSAVPDSGLSPGFIAGIVLAVLLVAAVVAAVVIYYRRKISELQKQNQLRKCQWQMESLSL